ncbi:preprotein translocase subunit SecG [Hyphomicrobium methylovorum]|uniref:preprotein translocase subunit SecG n=1 Tax=Hyphomicrobium methylovorum TaxID=84 RepID=UPI0015E6476E|nr:preprotein translocase subunit SecG [Hyphomicrobium methylovorum]MBA2127693.1 preprotein translocase subunit SecG [Hyphomicrobium methylovorum]
MATVLLIIHLMISVALVCVVLMQKSEGGALGIGGSGGGGGGFLTGRGTANLLTRMTAGLAALFFLTSILLTILARNAANQGSLFDATHPGSPPVTAPATPGSGEAPAGRGGVLDKLQQQGGPAVPQNQ